MRYIILLLLIPCTLTAGRKWTSGAEMWGTNLSMPKMGANAVEGQSTTTFGGSPGAGQNDRTGNGHAAYKFLTNGAERNFFDVRNLSLTPPINIRIWAYIGNAPPVQNYIAFLSNGVDEDVEVIWETNGKISLGRESVSKVTTAGAVATSTWILIKIYTNWSATTDTTRVTVNGEVLEDHTAHVKAIANTFNLGCYSPTVSTNPGSEFSADDIAINDASGSFENGAPDDSAFVMWLPALSDTAIGNWTAGAGSTSSLFEALNNYPVTGATSETNTTNIKNSTSSATDNYDAAVSSYQAAGVPSNKDVRLAVAVARHGENASTGTESGAVALLTNPADAGETTFTFGADAGAHVNDATTSTLLWRTTYGSYVYQPTIARTTRPTVRVGRRTANTNQVCVDMLGVMIEVGTPFPTTGHKRIIN